VERPPCGADFCCGLILTAVGNDHDFEFVGIDALTPQRRQQSAH
jgi:hypothetical protein